MQHRIWNWRNVGFAALVLAGIVVLAMAWQAILFAIVFFVVVGTGLSLLIGLPTFFISLCLEWSLAKAWERTTRVAGCCFMIVGNFLAAAI